MRCSFLGVAAIFGAVSIASAAGTSSAPFDLQSGWHLTPADKANTHGDIAAVAFNTTHKGGPLDGVAIVGDYKLNKDGTGSGNLTWGDETNNISGTFQIKVGKDGRATGTNSLTNGKGEFAGKRIEGTFDCQFIVPAKRRREVRSALQVCELISDRAMVATAGIGRIVRVVPNFQTDVLRSQTC